MDNKPLIKGICKLLLEDINKCDYSHEMSCLISEEFTPPTDYTYVLTRAKELCAKYRIGFNYFREAIHYLARKNHSNWSIYDEVSSTINYSVHEYV